MDKAKKIIIPRLAINDKFAWYSPGVLLVNEVIKWCYSNKILYELDLGLGSEKYKLDNGGILYEIYSGEFQL